MVDTKKEKERSELHKAIWKIANELRGSVDGWDFKQYVLGMLFYRFISENLSSYINENERERDGGDKNFDYASLDDSSAEFGRKTMIEEKGFFILPGELFENVCKGAENDGDLNETLESIFNNIESSAQGTDSEHDVRGLFDDLDVNSNKLGASVEKRNKKLVKLLRAIRDLPIGSYDDNSIDLFGDAYEYLMTMYAANAGKSGGEFFTPQEVSELLAQITVLGKKRVNKVYDPACGSGSLLLKFAKVLGKENVRRGFFGQEINITTYNLCRINMFLHDINYEKFDIAHGDTLIDPYHWDDEPFEAIVSNPPYSIKWEGDSNQVLINDERFTSAGVLAPKSKADLAFVMHALSWLAPNGTAAIVSFPGVMYRGGAEKKIRKYLVDNNFVDAVIQLPADLFFGTTIATCILVIKRSKVDGKVLFINASSEFVRGSAKNKLGKEHREKILQCYKNRITQEHFSRLVEQREIANKDYSISVNNYVEPEDTREVINIKELNAEIKKIIASQSVLHEEIDAIVADLEGVSNLKQSLGYSKNAINKAAKRLVDLKSDSRNSKGSFFVLQQFRSAHSYPMQSMLIHFRNKALKVDKRAIVLRRLKRLPSMISKLKRFPDMDVTRMGDIGGIRIVATNIENAIQIRDETINSRTRNILIYERDYLVNPKESGYRGIHLIYSSQGSKEEYRGLRVELQIRSRIQHAWATAVEVAGIFLGENLKASLGDKQWLEFFQIISPAFACLENGEEIMGAYKEKIISTCGELNAIEMLNSFSVTPQISTRVNGYYLLELDIDLLEMRYTHFEENQLQVALEAYQNIEQLISTNTKKDAVLVSAQSIAALKKGYPNYFANTKLFIRILKEVIARKFN